MNVLQAGMELERRILDGQFGPSGSRFPGVRELAEQIPCSYVTAVKTAEWLRRRGVIMLHGRSHYVTTGRCSDGSELEERLRQNRRASFGLIISSVDHASCAELYQQLARCLRPGGWDLMLMTHDGDSEAEARQLDQMLEMGLSGVFVVPDAKFENAQRYEHYPLPVVAVGRQTGCFGRCSVTVSHYSAGCLAARQFLENGYARFLYIGLKQKHPTVDLRLNGFVDTLQQAGRGMKQEDFRAVSDEDLSESLQELVQDLKRIPEPAGVFCFHDAVAAALLQTCQENGVNVPQEAGIIGCDDLPLAAASRPALSSIRYPFEALCRAAAEQMTAELEGKTGNAQYIEVQPEMQIRESSIRKEL